MTPAPPPPQGTRAGLPDAANSCTGFLVMCDMKPTMEKMTKPANMLVQELMQHTMMESLCRPRQSRHFQKRQKRPKDGDVGNLLVHVIVVGVVAAQCDERAQAQAVGEKDLSGCVQPHLWRWERKRTRCATQPRFAWVYKKHLL